MSTALAIILVLLVVLVALCCLTPCGRAANRRAPPRGDPLSPLPDNSESFGILGRWGPPINPFEQFLAGDPRSADTERENITGRCVTL